MNKENMALEELKIFQKTISDHEDVFLKIRGWSITLVSAISVGYLSDRISISYFEYVFLSLMIVVFFSWSEAIHRVAQTRAKNRSGEIEQAIRGEIEYNGPSIRATFTQGNTLACLLYTSPSPRDLSTSRMPSSA